MQVQLAKECLADLHNSTWASGRRCSSRSDNDLADLLIRFKIPMRFDDLLQWEGLGDHGLEVTISEAAQNEVLGARESIRVIPDR